MSKQDALDNESIIIDKYIHGQTIQSLRKYYRTTTYIIKNILQNNNVDIRPQRLSSRKYYYNEHYFDNIDTEDKAYFLGLLYADGCNITQENKIRITLQERDKDILEKFNHYISYNKPLFFIKKRDFKYQNMYSITFCGKHLSNQLTKLGCVARKSLALKFPNNNQVPQYLLRHFIRGLWDGDGSIGLYNRACASLSGSHDICLSTSKYLCSTLDINARVYAIGATKNFSTCDIVGTPQTLYFLNWLYKDATVYLERKYQKYQEIKEFNKTIDKTRSNSRFNKLL